MRLGTNININTQSIMGIIISIIANSFCNGHHLKARACLRGRDELGAVAPPPLYRLRLILSCNIISQNSTTLYPKQSVPQQ